MYEDRNENNGQCYMYADRKEKLGNVIIQIRRSRGKFMLGNIRGSQKKKKKKKKKKIIIIIMYADRKENTGQCNSAKITKNYSRLRFTSNGRECVRVSIVPQIPSSSEGEGSTKLRKVRGCHQRTVDSQGLFLRASK